MKHDDWLRALDREGATFGLAARRAGLSAPVPSCPGWTVADLVTHLGNVHRWVSAHVVRGVTDPPVFPRDKPDGELLEWYQAGLSRLCDVLSTVDPALPAWNFSPAAPNVAGFWPRRMAHETAVHRWDAELAAGQPTGFDPGFAADGVGEVVESMLARRAGREPLASANAVVCLECADTGDGWLVTLTPGRVDTARLAGDQSEPGATVTGPAERMYLVLWGRQPADTVTVTGDAEVAALVRTG